jgi:hypothetical protein
LPQTLEVDGPRPMRLRPLFLAAVDDDVSPY